jgi:hypothetical protein
MKKTILTILSIFPLMGFADSKTDSIFIQGKYVGLIDSISSKTSSYTNPEGKESIKKTITYRVTLDDFADRKEIEGMFEKKKSDDAEFIFVERFSSRSKIEIGGYYTKKAGELMNCRNNWRLGGAAVATAIVLIAPPSLVVYSAAALVGGVSSIVSMCKDYKANSMLKKAGDAMMSK